jgi:hypothetical protein
VNPKWACVSAWAMGVAVATTMMACGEGMAAPLERPGKTTEAPAATVLHVQGTVTVKPTTGTAFPARVGHELVRSDRLEPAEGAFTVLLLTNRHAVRIDDTGALAISDILLLNAPPTTDDVGTQVSSLLDPGEHIAEKAVRERAAAWRHMVRAGDTAGSVADDSLSPQKAGTSKEGSAKENRAKQDSPERSKAIAPGGGGSGARAGAGPSPAVQLAPAATAPPTEQAASGVPAQGQDASKPRDVEDVKKSRKDASDEGPTGGLAAVAVEGGAPSALLVRVGGTLVSARAPSATSTALPASLGDEQSLRTCLDGVINTTGAPKNAVQLLLQVKGGKVVRVRLSGALPVPACARALLQKPVTTADGWMVVTVSTVPKP